MSIHEKSATIFMAKVVRAAPSSAVVIYTRNSCGGGVPRTGGPKGAVLAASWCSYCKESRPGVVGGGGYPQHIIS